jgi:hypothetical protein
LKFQVGFGNKKPEPGRVRVELYEEIRSAYLTISSLKTPERKPFHTFPNRKNEEVAEVIELFSRDMDIRIELQSKSNQFVYASTYT